MGFSVDEEDENDSEQNNSENEEAEEQKQPLKLHRRWVDSWSLVAIKRNAFGIVFWKFTFVFFENRDTPHHLKNKRVQQGGIDKATANILLANTLRQIEPERVIEEPHGISDVHAYETEQLHVNGKWAPDWFIYFACKYGIHIRHNVAMIGDSEIRVPKFSRWQTTDYYAEGNAKISAHELNMKYNGNCTEYRV